MKTDRTNSIIAQNEFIDTKEIGSAGISYKTIGTTLQALSVQLDEGEYIYSEAGKMSWMTNNIEMSTHGQGCFHMISRFFSKESVFINKFSSKKGTGFITFTTDQVGKILPLTLDKHSSGIIFQKGAYLCSEKNVKRTLTLTKRLSAGLFGGKGIILQQVEGRGKVHLVADGEIILYKLKPNQEIVVDQGNLIAYENTVDFDIQTIKGPVNWLLGGEGLFFGVLKGPGKIWLQTRKKSLAKSISSHISVKHPNVLGRFISIAVSLILLMCVLSSILLEILSKR